MVAQQKRFVKSQFEQRNISRETLAQKIDFWCKSKCQHTIVGFESLAEGRYDAVISASLLRWRDNKSLDIRCYGSIDHLVDSSKTTTQFDELPFSSIKRQELRQDLGPFSSIKRQEFRQDLGAAQVVLFRKICLVEILSNNVNTSEPWICHRLVDSSKLGFLNHNPRQI